MKIPSSPTPHPPIGYTINLTPCPPSSSATSPKPSPPSTKPPACAAACAPWSSPSCTGGSRARPVLRDGGRRAARLHRPQRRRQIDHDQDADRHPVPHQRRGRGAGLCPWQKRRQLAYQIGTVFGQRPQLWYHLPAIDTFALFGKIYELDDKETRKRISFLAEAFEIEDLLETPVRKLSLGQRMRCEVAASLLHKPRLLLLDEPSIGLDVVAKQHIRDTIRRMNQLEGVGVLLTSHDAGDLEALCKRVIVINHGQIVYQDKVSNMKRHYLTSKLVEVRYAEPIAADFHIDGAETVKIGKDRYGAKLRFDTRHTPVAAVIARLAEAGSVVDMTISDASLEEVIRTIYSEKDVPEGGK